MRKLLSLAVVVALCGTSSVGLAVPITTPGNPITAIWQTTIAGNSTTSTAGNGEGLYPGPEGPANAIDGLYTEPYPPGTKHLNFGTGGGDNVSTPTKGVGTGFYVTPAVGSSIVTGIQVATANDSPERDPITVSIEGSNATGAALNLGSSWFSIINSVNLGIGTDPGRYFLAPIVGFTNTTPYTSYRVLVQSQRANANSVQYGEMNLHGLLIPEPSTIVLAGAGLIGVVVAIRRRRS